jgi:hypothetical protein
MRRRRGAAARSGIAGSATAAAEASKRVTALKPAADKAAADQAAAAVGPAQAQVHGLNAALASAKQAKKSSRQLAAGLVGGATVHEARGTSVPKRQGSDTRHASVGKNQAERRRLPVDGERVRHLRCSAKGPAREQRFSARILAAHIGKIP